MNVVELCARAAITADYDKYNRVGVTCSAIERGLYIDKRCNEYEAAVLAVIDTLAANVSPAMEEAGRNAPLVSYGNGQYGDPHPSEVFRAMLAAAMKEQG